MKIFGTELSNPTFRDVVVLFFILIVMWGVCSWLSEKHIITPHYAWLSFVASSTGALLSFIGIQVRKNPILFMGLGFVIYVTLSSLQFLNI